MPQFAYRALDQRGALHRGIIDAPDISAGQAELLRRGLTPVRMRPASTAQRARPAAISSASAAHLPLDELSDLLGDLATIVSASVPLNRALEIVGDGAASPAVRRLVARAVDRLREGRDVATILSSEDDRTGFLEGLVRAGQVSGDLGQALRHAAEILRRDLAIRRDLVSTLSYPAFVFVALLAGVIVILAFVAPALAPLLDEIAPGEALFLRALIATSDLLLLIGPWLLALLLLSALGGAITIASGRLAHTLDQFMAYGPFGGSVRDLECGAWAIGAGRLVANGVPAPHAVVGAAAFARNSILRGEILRLADRMRDGASLAGVLSDTPIIPSSIARMAYVGEGAGALGAMLERAGEHAQTRALRRIKRSADTAAPIALLAMGALIGMLVSGLLTGVASIGGAAL